MGLLTLKVEVWPAIALLVLGETNVKMHMVLVINKLVLVKYIPYALYCQTLKYFIVCCVV